MTLQKFQSHETEEKRSPEQCVTGTLNQARLAIEFLTDVGAAPT